MYDLSAHDIGVSRRIVGGSRFGEAEFEVILVMIVVGGGIDGHCAVVLLVVALVIIFGGDGKRDARASGASCTFVVAGCGGDNVVRYCLR